MRLPFHPRATPEKNKPMELLHSHFLGQATVCATPVAGFLCCFCVMGHDAAGLSSHTRAVLLGGLSSPTFCHFEGLQAALRHKALVFSNSNKQRRHLSHPDVASKVQAAHFACPEFRAMRITNFVKYLCVIIGLQGHPHLWAKPLCSFCPVCSEVRALTKPCP